MPLVSPGTRLLLLATTCAVLSACASRGKSAAAAATTSAPTFTLDSISPPPGTVVSADSVFRAAARYHVPHFVPGLWRVVVLFEMNDGSFIGAPMTHAQADLLPDSSGVLRIQQPFEPMWDNEDLARPFRLHVWLNQNEGNGRSHSVVQHGPFVYHAAP